MKIRFVLELEVLVGSSPMFFDTKNRRLQAEASLNIPCRKIITLKSIHAHSMKDLITVKIYLPIDYLHPKHLSNSEFGSFLDNLEEHLAKIFGKLHPHVKPSGFI
jgi:hypothetical protein